jgi:hypothetical protein
MEILLMPTLKKSPYFFLSVEPGFASIVISAFGDIPIKLSIAAMIRPILFEEKTLGVPPPKK